LHGLKESFENLGIVEKERIFQQDNPKHGSEKAEKWFKDQGIKLLVWPSQSPDLNYLKR